MSHELTKVFLSENETSLLNLKVGRCVSGNFDSTELTRQILENQYDICRLTTSSADEDVVAKLEQTGLPYFYSGSITRYKTAVRELKAQTFIHDDLEYEQYDGTQNDLLLQLLIGTWGTYPIGYYRSPLLKHLVTKEQEIIAVCEFYKKHNLQRDYPNNTIMFIRHRGNYVGFFALNIIDDRLESHIGGIVEPYRKDGYFFDMQEYIRRFCVNKQLNYFAFGARNENRRVNEIFQKFGYRAVDSDNVFHIASLLSYNGNMNTILNEIDISYQTPDEIYTELYLDTIKHVKTFLTTIPVNLSFKINQLNNLSPGKYFITYAVPVNNAEAFLMTIKIYNTENKLVSFGYLNTN